MATFVCIYHCATLYPQWSIQLDRKEPLQMVWQERGMLDAYTGIKQSFYWVIWVTLTKIQSEPKFITPMA